MKIDLKKVLLAGTAIVAVGAFASAKAHAADTEMAGAAGAPTNMLTGFTGGDDLVNIVDDANDFGEIDVNGNVTAATINSDFTGGLAVYDSDNGAANTLTISGYADVATTSTLTLLFGGTIADGSGTDGATTSTLAITGTLGESGAGTLTRGGTLAILGTANEPDGPGVLTVGGNTLMTTITSTGGAGAAAAGGAVTSTFGNASTDTFNVTGMAVTGGAGSGAANGVAGGASTVTVNGAASIGTGNLAVTGGDADAGAGTGASGGNATLTFNHGTTITGGTVTVTGGADHNSANGHGGDAALTFVGNVTSNSTLALSTGAQAAGGGGLSGDAAVTFGGNATFTAINLDDLGDGAATLTFNGTSAQTISGDIDGVGSADGDIVITNSHASGVTFNDEVGLAAGDGINSITLNDAGSDVLAVFTENVTVGAASGLVVGTGGGNTATVRFNTTGGDFVMSGTVDGDAGSTSNVIVSGGNTLETDAIWGGTALNTVTITGSGTDLELNADLTAADISIGSGSTLSVDTGSAITGDIDGASAGAGTFEVDAATNVAGSIGDTNRLSAVRIAEGVTLTVTGGAAREIAATTILLEDAASDGTDAGLTLDTNGSAFTVSNAITVGVDGEGLVTITDDNGGTVAFTADIGTSTNALGVLTITNGGNTVGASTTGNLWVDAFTIGQADTFTFLGTGAQSVSGTIAGNGGNNRGTLVLGNGTTITPTVTFNGVIGGGGNTLAALTVNDDSTAIFNADATFAGALSADVGTIRVANGATLTAATQTDPDVTTWQIVVDKVGGGAQTNGTVAFTGDGVDLTVDTVHFMVNADTAPLTTGASVLANVFQGNGANSIVAGATVTDNSFLYDFALVGAVDANIDVTITQANSVVDSSVTPGNANVGTVLLTDLAASTNAQINDLQGAMLSAPTQEAFNEVLESVQPTVDGGAMVGAMNVTMNTLGITTERLASLRTGNETGMTTGNVSQGLRWWLQGFGATATQDRRDNIDGFDADTFGGAIGLDTQNMGEDTVVGVAFSYGDTEVDSKNANQTSSNIDSYQVTLYADHDIDEATYVNGMLAYTWSEVDTIRQNLGGLGNLDAAGDYDADQFTASLEVGRDYEHGETTVTPHAGLMWSHYDADGYTETGAGGANLVVESDSVDVVEIGLGVDFSWLIQNANGSYFSPELRLGYAYDAAGDQVETTASFVGGGPSFKSEGFDPAQHSFDLGAGITYFSTDNWELTADYNFEYKSDYDNHSGFLRAAYKF